EFRNQSCFRDEMIALLKKHRAGLVIPHSSRYPSPNLLATTDFVYFRFHGPIEMFASSYSDDDLRQWAHTLLALSATTQDIYAFSNNASGGHAPGNAGSVLHLTGPRGARLHEHAEESLQLTPGAR